MNGSNLIKETQSIMKKYNIKANKSLGQNFLINENVLDNIVNVAQITKNDLVIEIGPGLGVLTKKLLNIAKKVISIEIDPKMIRILQDRFNVHNNFELLNEDVLKVDLNNIIEQERKKDKEIQRIKIVANLPYYITTPIIMKLLEEELDIESITVMIQKEVAERLTATPGEKYTGAITYTVFYYAESEKIMEVSKDSFIPAPEVTSEVIKLNIRKKTPVQIEDKQKMFEIIKKSFMQKRKTLLNALTNTNIFTNKQQGEEILKKCNLEKNIRAEKLSIQDFVSITKQILTN